MPPAPLGSKSRSRWASSSSRLSRSSLRAGQVLAKPGQFLVATGQFFAAGGQFAFPFGEPKADGPAFGLELGQPGVQFGLAAVEFLLSVAKMGGQLIGLETNLFASRCVGERRGRRPLPNRRRRSRNPDFVGTIDSLGGGQTRSSAREDFARRPSVSRGTGDSDLLISGKLVRDHWPECIRRSRPARYNPRNRQSFPRPLHRQSEWFSSVEKKGGRGRGKAGGDNHRKNGARDTEERENRTSGQPRGCETDVLCLPPLSPYHFV